MHAAKDEGKREDLNEAPAPQDSRKRGGRPVRCWSHMHAGDNYTFLIADRLSSSMRPGLRIRRAANLKTLPPAATALANQKPLDRPVNADAALPSDIQMTARITVPRTHRAPCPAVNLQRSEPSVSP